MQNDYDYVGAKLLLRTAIRTSSPDEQDKLLSELWWTGFFSVPWMKSAYVYTIYREMYWRPRAGVKKLFNKLPEEERGLDYDKRWSVETLLQRATSEGMTVRYAEQMKDYLLLVAMKEERKEDGYEK